MNQLPRQPRSFLPNPADERGRGAVEYAALIGTVAVVAGAVLVMGVPERVGTLLSSGVCAVVGSDDCEETSAQTASGDQEPRPVSPPSDPEEPGGDEEDPDLSRCEGSWPDLVGLDAEQAKRLLEDEDPELSVSVVPEDSLTTTDFQCGRVRLYTDPDDGTVTSAPSVG